ncbi:hypothetical protein BC829DRAFT_421633 [Chytridium lagenaria]|nr:hypothetical protein BC829DRAFT_421633 [Chytridium lagenaria]
MARPRTLLALPLLYVNRSWSRGTARGLYKCPYLPTLEKFQALLSVALEPLPTHPYAALWSNFIFRNHLPRRYIWAISTLPFSSSQTSPPFSLSDHCHGLKRLSLRGCPISDALVPSLASGCPKLELLDLSHTRVTIATLVTAVDLCTSLTSLVLEAAFPSSVPVTWNPQQLFIRPLRYLNLRNSGATDPHLRHAALHCPDLSHVVLEGSAALTDDSLIKLSQSCSSLRILDASFCPHLTDLSLRSLAMFASTCLASVSLSGCDRITPEGVEALAEGCKLLEEIVLHGCASILDSHIRGFATKRYELDCAIRGDAVRLVAASRAGRVVAGPLAAAAKVTGLEKREFATQTTVEEGKVEERRTVSRTESEDTVTDTSDMTKASTASSSTSSATSSRMSMPAEELLLKFAEAVAAGTWFPRGAEGHHAPNPAGPTPYSPWAAQQPMFWNPAWGYPPPQMYPPSGLPEDSRRVSTTSTHSNASTSLPHSNRSSFISETSSTTSTGLPMPPGSKLRRLSAVQESTPPISPPKPLGQRSQLPSSSKLPAMSSRIPSMGASRLPSLSSSLPQPATPSVATSAAAKQFSIAMMKGSKTVGGVTGPVVKEETYKPRQFRKINSDYEPSTLTSPPKTPQKTMLRPPSMSRSNSTTASPPRSSARASIDPTALAAFTSTLPDGVKTALSRSTSVIAPGTSVTGRMRTSVAHPLTPSGVSVGWISAGEVGEGGDRRSTGSTGSVGSVGKPRWVMKFLST